MLLVSELRQLARDWDSRRELQEEALVRALEDVKTHLKEEMHAKQAERCRETRGSRRVDICAQNHVQSLGTEPQRRSVAGCQGQQRETGSVEHCC